MNDKQRYVIFAAVAIIALMLIVPPWEAFAPNGNSSSVGFSLIFSAPDYNIVKVNVTQLIAQWVCVAIIGGGLFLGFKDKE